MQKTKKLKEPFFPMKHSIIQQQKGTFLAVICSCVFSLLVMGEKHHFLAWENPDNHRLSRRDDREKVVYRFPLPLPDFQVSELIPSWNLQSVSDGFLDVVIHASFLSGKSRMFNMGRWAKGGQSLDQMGPRTSINDQKNDYGVVYTDTLVFKQTPTDCEVELRLYPGNEDKGGTLDFFGVCLSPPPALDELLRPSPILETRLIDVPLLCQRDYIGGGVWCSPTSVTMIMHYWSKKLARSDLRYSVSETANLVYDPGWPGTGNWAFNVAFAGGHLNMRAHVNRLNAIDELRALIDAGVPVAASVSYDLLKGKSVKGNNDGHLVVVVGFDQSGDPMINDPAACPEVQRSYPLEHFIKAWQSSRQTVYIIYPSKISLPGQLEIHWQ